MTYQITKTFDFCYGHRLMRHNGKCKRLHGHTARVEIVLEDITLDENGFVRDFNSVKEHVAIWVMDHWDHRLLLEKSDPLVLQMQQSQEPHVVLDCPPSAENLAQILFQRAKSVGLPVVRLDFWESATSKATVTESKTTD